MLRVLEELLYTLRREGFAISIPQAIDAARALDLVGFEDPATLRAALSAVLVERASDLPRFRAAFDRFFSSEGAHPGDLFGRLRERGFSDEEIGALRGMLTELSAPSGAEALAMRAITGAESELDHILGAAGFRRDLERLASSAQIGFFTEKALARLGVRHAGTAIRALRRALVDALGDRGGLLADALDDEVARLRKRVRERIDRRARHVERDGREATPFHALSPAEADAIRRGVRRIAERLRGREMVRRRRARRGRIDAGRTMRKALSTFGVPFVLARKRPRPDRAKLVVLADVSESVRSASAFMLEFTAQVVDLFVDARSFVFVGDVAETTRLFRDEPTPAALAAIASGRVVNLGGNSNYGRALRAFRAALEGALDRRTTIAILGDGRTNQLDDGLDALQDLARRARGVLWICPEPPSSWTGDSAMPRYQRAVTQVLEARSAEDLERAARLLVRFR
ncbi:MAG: VWA domain-containing protein [Polyangiaceae bacterium]